MFGSSPKKIEGLYYVTPVTGHKAYTGKEEEKEDCKENTTLHHYKDQLVNAV
jgi:hypothetical protein